MPETYCGPAPTPDTILSAWNPDAVALGLCLALLGVHVAQRRGGRPFLWLGIGLLGVLFLSPLCALTSALFSARVVHHVLLIAVVAPLLALAFPARGAMERIPLGWLVALHAAVLWLWHAPEIYAVAIEGAVPYWLMQGSLLGTGFLLWQRVLAPQTNAGAALLALLATTIQMGLLGALLTFAAEPLYEPHLRTTLAFGLSPLDDQQLGGLVMWVPAALPYLVAALMRLSASLGAGEEHARPAAAP